MAGTAMDYLYGLDNDNVFGLIRDGNAWSLDW
jgi:hypothetical protein